MQSLSPHTDFFAHIDNFKRLEGKESIKVFESPCRTEDTFFTIAIPAFKRADLLKEAIDSVLNQENPPKFEILVVDDNPERNDEVEILMSEYEPLGVFSYYKNKENLGLFDNWNKLFQLTKTKWMVMLHDDDILYPSHLRDCASILSSYKETDLLTVGRLFWFQYKGEPFPENFYKDKYFKIQKLEIGYIYNVQRGCAPSGYVFNRNTILRYGGYNPEWSPSSDYILYANLIKNGVVLHYKKPLMVYRFLNNLTLKVSIQETSLPIDYYFRMYLGNLMRYKKLFSNFVARKNAISRFKNILASDCNYRSPIEELKEFAPSRLRLIFYTVYDIIDGIYWDSKLKSIRWRR